MKLNKRFNIIYNYDTLDQLLKDKNILIDPSKYIKNYNPQLSKQRAIKNEMDARNQRFSVNALHFGSKCNS